MADRGVTPEQEEAAEAAVAKLENVAGGDHVAGRRGAQDVEDPSGAAPPGTEPISS